MDMSDTVTTHLRTLTRGLAQRSNDQIYKSYRELFKLGEAVIPAVKEQILSQPWDDIKYGEQLRILSGLLSLTNDINEERAREIGKIIRENGCNSIVESRIRSITEFTLNEFESFSISGVNIYLSKKLGGKDRIKKKMAHWLSMVPACDLDEVERIYLIPETNEDHRGTYMPILCSIMVEWDISVSYYNPLSYIFLFQIEKTLYHEIGHHVHRHTFGQDPDQEREANQYAATILRKSHPLLRVMVKTVKNILGKQKVREQDA